VSYAQQIEELYEKHAVEVLHYLARRCPDGAAPDLLQETFLQVIRQKAGLAGIATPRAWLFGIARHILARHYRQNLVPVPDERWSEYDASEPVDPRLSLMRESIQQLPPELRETLELRLEQELSYEDIARVLEIPVGTVRSRLHTALIRLRAALTNQKESS
jgi:RNA polymerase sigma factor (sigma-70 family)